MFSSDNTFVESLRAGEYLTYPAHSSVILTDLHSNKRIPRGYLYIVDVSRPHIAAADNTINPTITLTLYPAEKSGRDGSFIRSNPRMTVNVTAEQFRSVFGRAFPIGAIPQGMIKKTLKGLFIKAGRGKDFDDSIDYDRIFKGIAEKLFRKFPGNLSTIDKEDLILDTFLQVVTPQTIRNYSSNLNAGVYFGQMFQNRLINELKALSQKRLREIKRPHNPDSDLTDEEFFDLVDKRQKVDPTTDEVEFSQLQKDLIRFFSSKPEAKYFVPMFNMLVEGYSNKEISEKLKVSPAIITRYLDRMRQGILEFSRMTGNQLLYSLMSEYMGKRKSDKDVIDPIVDVLLQYKKRVSELALLKGNVKSSKTIQIEKVSIPTKSKIDYAAMIALDAEPGELMDEALTRYFENLLKYDELIDRDDNTIVGLNVRDR